MTPNLDIMGVAGMVFVIAFMVVIAWIGRAVILKGMDMAQAREQTKADLKHQEELRRLAQQALRAQDATAEQLRRLEHLEGIETRLAEVERLLREVDEPALARR